MLEAGPTSHELALAQAGVTKAADHIEYGRRKLERTVLLFKYGLVARSALDDAEEESHATEGDVVEAKARLNALAHSVRPEQIEEIAAQIDRLDTDRRLIRQQLGSLQVLSPAAGIVGTPERQLLQMTHQLVRMGDPIAKIYDFTTIKAQIVISEKDISEVKVGQPVELKARAYPQAVFHGKVTFISTSANGPPAGAELTNPSASAAAAGKALNVVVVNTEIDNHAAMLKPEMTGQARIDCGQRRVIDLIVWHVTRYLRVDSLSW